jgi:peptide/nickel transport system permease protein
MIQYVIKRILWMIPVLVCVAILIFTIMFFVPGDVTSSILGGAATPDELANLKHLLGLDQPYFPRLLHFLERLFFHFDFGASPITQKPVLPDLLQRLPRTATIAFGSIIIAIICGLPLGITAAVHQDTAVDRASIFISLLGVSMPNFWLALLLILLFSLTLGWLPSFGMGGLKYYIMPWIASCFGVLANLARQSRSSMLEVIREDYITTARAKGVLRREVIFGHALPNALIPVVTVAGTSLAAGFGGSLIIEQVYSVPGLGLYMINGINSRDYIVVQASVVFISFIFSVIMLLVDLLYAFIDPRIKAQYVSVKKRKASDDKQENV